MRFFGRSDVQKSVYQLWVGGMEGGVEGGMRWSGEKIYIAGF
jgi:hypothetical protein